MISSEFVTLTGKFIEESPPFDYMLRLLIAIGQHHHSLRSQVLAVASAQSNSTPAHSAQNALTGALRQIGESIRSDFETRKVWAGVEDLGKRCRAVAASPLTQEVGENIASQLSQFSEAYENFVKTYSVESTLILVELGNDLHISVDSLRMTSVLASKALLEPPIPS